MKLIPAPRKLSAKRGSFSLADATISFDAKVPSSITGAIAELADEIYAVTFKRPSVLRTLNNNASIRLSIKAGKNPEAYNIEITAGQIELCGESEQGLFYAVQTLRQLIRTEGPSLPCLSISDSPDFPVRGFYHDVTRGKVPKLETLMELAEKMSFYKLNHMQLYVEHTFAFKNHADIWAGSDPLTHEEILKLGEHCEKLHIDLAPSISTFGHFYTALRSPRKEHLNELDIKASEKPFSLHDRMAHYTLDCMNPESLALVTEMIEESIPLYKSPYFNICCDETFDLGRGRNAKFMEEAGEGRLYIDFLKKIMQPVIKHGRKPMFWGDIILKNPSLIPEIPKEAIALSWTYGANPDKNNCLGFSKSGRSYFVCPGVTGWNHWVNDINTSTENIRKFVEMGKKNGACGVLNTDWGDYGHINLLANSMHGMIFGAEASWNIKEAQKTKDFDRNFSLLEFGDASGKIAELWRKVNSLESVQWWAISRLFDHHYLSSDEIHSESGLPVHSHIMDYKPASIAKSRATLLQLAEEIRQTAFASKKSANAELAYRELLTGIKGLVLMNETALLIQKAAGRKSGEELSFNGTSDEIRRFESELTEIWHMRNKPSEYHVVRNILLKTAELLDKLGVRQAQDKKQKPSR